MNNIRMYRQKVGITQTELSKRTGIIATTISRLESGEYPLTLNIAEQIAPHLNCTADELIGDDKVRIMIVTARKEYKPTFREVFESFLSSFDREFINAQIYGKYSDSFREEDLDSRDLYDILNQVERLDEDGLRELFIMMYRLTRKLGPTSMKDPRTGEITINHGRKKK